MKEVTDNSIESKIILLLQKKSMSTIDVVEHIQKVRPGTPKQSVYLSLRKLREKEIIVINHKNVSLHQVWVSKMKMFFDAVNGRENSKDVHPNKMDITGLQEKESVIYKFNSLLSLDMYWTHAFVALTDPLNNDDTVFLYNPHELFLIVRKESEVTIMKEMKRRGIAWRHLVAGNKPLDKEIKRYFDQDYAKCHFLGKGIFEDNYYLNCLGDFLIEVWLDVTATKEIESLYNKYTTVGPDVIRELQGIIENKKFTHKMKISRNSTKSNKARKMFSNYFLVK